MTRCYQRLSQGMDVVTSISMLDRLKYSYIYCTGVKDRVHLSSTHLSVFKGAMRQPIQVPSAG